MFCFVEQLCIPDCGEVAKKAEAEAVFKELLASCTSRLARTTLGVRPHEEALFDIIRGSIMNLYKRDYIKSVPTKQEMQLYEGILCTERKAVGDRGFGKINHRRLYPAAVRHYDSLFPNNHIELFDFQNEGNMEQLNELYYSYRSTLEKCEFQELYQSLWVEVLADLPRFNPDLGRATTFFRYSIKHAVCIFVSFKKYNTTPYLANQLEKIKKIQQECEESGTPFTVELASKYLHCTIPTVLNYQVKLGMESSFSYEVISVTNKYFSYDSYDEEATDSKPISSYSDAELRKLVKDFSEKELCLLNMYLQMCTQENSYNIEEFRKAKASQSAMTKAETEQAIIKIEDLFKKIGING